MQMPSPRVERCPARRTWGREGQGKDQHLARVAARIPHLGPGRWPQQYRTQSALLEDLGSICSPHGSSQPPLSLVPRDPMPSSALKGIGYGRGTQTYLQISTFILAQMNENRLAPICLQGSALGLCPRPYLSFATTGDLRSSPRHLWSSSGLPGLLEAACSASPTPPWPPRPPQGPVPGTALWFLSLWPLLQPGPALLHSAQRRPFLLPAAV